MDLSTQIKNNLISRIKDSDDLNFLKSLQTFLDSSEKSLYQLTPEQENSIAISREQIKNGETFDSGTVISEMREWLTKK